MTVEDWVDRSAELDVDGLEFYWPFVPWRDEGRVERLRARVAAQGTHHPDDVRLARLHPAGCRSPPAGGR